MPKTDEIDNLSLETRNRLRVLLRFSMKLFDKVRREGLLHHLVANKKMKKARAVEVWKLLQEHSDLMDGFDLDTPVGGVRNHSPVRLCRQCAGVGCTTLNNMNVACVDCQEFAEEYIVHDEVWEKAKMEQEGGSLCLHCLEARLGRRIDLEDLKETAALNKSIMYFLGKPPGVET